MYIRPIKMHACKVCYFRSLWLIILLIIVMMAVPQNQWGPSSPSKSSMESIDDILAGKVATLEQDDERFISYFRRSNFLRPPPNGGYSLKWPQFQDQSTGQAQYILTHVLKKMRNGFFVECGALDGETRSNTLFVERELGWRGLLIEADPSNYLQLLSRNRNAWSSNVCLATKPYPHVVKFKQQFNLGKIISDLDDKDTRSATISHERKEAEVQCIPFYTLMTAMNVTVVDYFSLDVEGAELKVLKTIPFDKILMKVLSVEFVHTHEGKNELREYMENLGFKTAKNVSFPHWPVADYIFIHPSVINSTADIGY